MLIGVYGSLKKGKHNHPMLGVATFKGGGKVKGRMFSLGSYPMLVEPAEGDESKEYQLEVYDVPTDVFDAVDNMELGAGYKRVQVDTEFGSATVYYGDTSYDYLRKYYKEVDTW